ncbi:hypothetical protein FA95DRAFT_116612 [Auriscalpium vulgare]|uniref:Uncharacterized protein n=1 Tax=Auriscalpium vulgare TaxID=40419 RepID=A0ACB8RNR0_9AGAM|nr:hypothetical protein FA95DRAFT_116612 [Auriscalpium vulgare]
MYAYMRVTAHLLRAFEKKKLLVIICRTDAFALWARRCSSLVQKSTSLFSELLTRSSCYSMRSRRAHSRLSYCAHLQRLPPRALHPPSLLSSICLLSRVSEQPKSTPPAADALRVSPGPQGLIPNISTSG